MQIGSAQIFAYSRHTKKVLPTSSSKSTIENGHHIRRGLLAKLTSVSGLESWGEAAPLPGRSTESFNDAKRSLLNAAPELVGLELPVQFSDVVNTARPGNPFYGLGFESAVLPSSVCFALEHAVFHLCAKQQQCRLSEWLRADCRDAVPVNALLSANDPECAKMGHEAFHAGFQTFKIKIGGQSIADDLAVVSDVRAQVGMAVELRLDANRAWSFEDATEFLAGAADLNIQYVEEPLALSDRLPELAHVSPIGIAIDESVAEAYGSAESLARFTFASAAVLKPTLTGGITSTLEVAKEFAQLGTEPVVTSAFETEVGMSALYHVAAACPGSGMAAGLSTLDMFDSRIQVGPILESGHDLANVEPDPVELTRLL